MYGEGRDTTMEKWLDTGEGVSHQIWLERARRLMETIWAFARVLLADGVIYRYDGAYKDTVWTRLIDFNNCNYDNPNEYGKFDSQTVLAYWNAFDIFSAVGELLTLKMLKPHGMQFAPHMPSPCTTQ